MADELATSWASRTVTIDMVDQLAASKNIIDNNYPHPVCNLIVWLLYKCYSVLTCARIVGDHLLEYKIGYDAGYSQTLSLCKRRLVAKRINYHYPCNPLIYLGLVNGLLDYCKNEDIEISLLNECPIYTRLYYVCFYHCTLSFMCTNTDIPAYECIENDKKNLCKFLGEGDNCDKIADITFDMPSLSKRVISSIKELHKTGRCGFVADNINIFYDLCVKYNHNIYIPTEFISKFHVRFSEPELNMLYDIMTKDTRVNQYVSGQCHVCLDPADIVYGPCGHFNICKRCMDPNVLYCNVCNTEITVKLIPHR